LTGGFLPQSKSISFPNYPQIEQQAVIGVSTLNYASMHSIEDYGVNRPFSNVMAAAPNIRPVQVLPTSATVPNFPSPQIYANNNPIEIKKVSSIPDTTSDSRVNSGPRPQDSSGGTGGTGSSRSANNDDKNMLIKESALLREKEREQLSIKEKDKKNLEKDRKEREKKEKAERKQLEKEQKEREKNYQER